MKFLVGALTFLITTSCWAQASRDFDGLDDIINCGALSASDFVPVSYVAWARPESAGESNFGRITHIGTADTFQIISAPPSELQISGDYTTADMEKNSVDTFVINGWNAVAGTWDGGTNSATPNTVLYVLGVDQGNGGFRQDATGTRVSNANTNLLIGNRAGTDRTWDGQLAYVYVYNRQLSQVEVQEMIYFPGTLPDGLTGFWPLWGDSTEIDLSGNGNTCTVTGSAVNSNGPPVAFGRGLPL